MVAAILIFLVGALAWSWLPDDDALRLAPDQEGRVLLAPFVNETGDPSLDWTQLGLHGLVAESLDGLDEIEVVDWALIDDNLLLGSDTDVGSRFEIDAERARRAAGAELLILTRVESMPDGFRFLYRSHNVLGSSSQRGLVVADLMQGAELLTSRLASQMGVRAELIGLDPRFSEDPFVNRLYAMGRHRFMTTNKGDGAALLFGAALDVDPDFLRARLALAEVLDWQGDHARAKQEYLNVLALAETVADDRVRADTLRAFGAFLVDEPEGLGPAVEALQEALQLQRGLGDRRAEAEVLRALGRAHLATFEQVGDPMLKQTGNSYNRQALELFHQFGDPLSHVFAYYLEAGLALAADDLEQAESHIRAAIDRAVNGRIVIMQALGNMRLQNIFEARQDYDNVMVVARNAVDLHRSIDNWIGLSTALGNLGLGHELKGELELAEAAYRDAFEVADRHGFLGRRALALRQLGRCLNKQGRHVAALVELGKVELERRPSVHILLGISRAQAGLGRWRQAVEALEEAKVLFRDDWSTEREAELSEYRRRAT